MEKYQWIDPAKHSIAVDEQRQPFLNENGKLILLDRESASCVAVPNSREILDIFGIEYSDYDSPSGSPRDSPEPDVEPINPYSDTNPLLWTLRTPCEKDILATKEMLALVASKKYQDMFNDQCTVKIRVWKRICEDLISKGFRIADSLQEGGVKCHQKWRNLEKSYRKFLISSTESTSSAPKKPPPYFELLHEILKDTKKYSNAATYAQTDILDDDMIVPDMPQSIDAIESGDHNYHFEKYHLADSDPIEVLDDIDDSNVIRYLVNSDGQVTKWDPQTVRSTSTGDGGGSSGSGPTTTTTTSGGGRHLQPPEVLVKILEVIYSTQREILVMHERLFNTFEQMFEENNMYIRQLSDFLSQMVDNSTVMNFSDEQ